MELRCAERGGEPAPPEELRATPGAKPSAEDRLRREVHPTVLLVEDDADVRTALSEWLELTGYAPVAAADGQEALDRLRGGLEPSAIVLDLMMPGMDGWTFLTHLRADPARADLRVIVASAVAREIPQGADAYLPKPFDLAELSRTIARFCGN